MSNTLSKLQEVVMDREAVGSRRVRHNWEAELNAFYHEETNEEHLVFSEWFPILQYGYLNVPVPYTGDPFLMKWGLTGSCVFSLFELYRPLGYSPFLQGVGWVMEMFLQWIAELVVESLWCVGIKMSSLGNPLMWLRSGPFRGSGWMCKHFLFTSLWNPGNKGKLSFTAWFSYFLTLIFPESDSSLSLHPFLF